MPLHVAVDAQDLMLDDRGIGRYVRSLLALMLRRDDARFTLLVREPLPLLRRAPFARALELPSVRVANRIPRDADVVWHPWNGTFFAGGKRNVATIHDVRIFAFPDPDPFQREKDQTPFRRSAATASLIVAVSEYTRAQIERLLDVPARRIVVVPNGVDPMFEPGPADALPPELRGRRFILHVGAQDRYKNVATLVAAHAQAFPGNEVALVFTRAPRPPVPGAFWYDHPDDALLLALYRAATLVAVPSLYEGFGLPVLEAMACGTSVLASRIASIPEVGGDTIRYVDSPSDAGAWAQALREALATPERDDELRRRARERAALFSWKRCADETFDVLRRVADMA
jgi:glycosyltransferase involved in cell wall biosynthesis